MRSHLIVGSLSFAVAAFTLTASAQGPEAYRGLFQPLPKVAESAANSITPEKVALGKKLFLETRLSKSRKLSCNSCHHLDTFGVDNEKTSLGHEDQRGTRNSPSVYNAALHFAQFWDGRAKDVEEQALGPIMNPVEMAMGAEVDVLKILKEDKEYSAAFKGAFPGETDPVTFKNVGKAIGAFERTLMTPSRFDDFLNGDKDALTPGELMGLETFRNVGCVACHSGVAVGGQMFQKLGLVQPYATKDLGRYEVTKNEADKYVFKVPSLRNVDKTAPYFHDGSITTLDEAVKLMGKHQLGKDLSATEVSEIITFLRTLTAK